MSILCKREPEPDQSLPRQNREAPRALYSVIPYVVVGTTPGHVLTVRLGYSQRTKWNKFSRMETLLRFVISNDLDYEKSGNAKVFHLLPGLKISEKVFCILCVELSSSCIASNSSTSFDPGQYLGAEATLHRGASGVTPIDELNWLPVV